MEVCQKRKEKKNEKNGIKENNEEENEAKKKKETKVKDVPLKKDERQKETSEL